MAQSPRVRWSLEHHGGDTYRLTNAGDVDAWDVIVDMHQTMLFGDEPPSYEHIGPDNTEMFKAAPVLATPDFVVTVSWNATRGRSETRQQWRYPLPIPPQR